MSAAISTGGEAGRTDPSAEDLDFSFFRSALLLLCRKLPEVDGPSGEPDTSMKHNIVLGVTGSIAAYKAADLTSQLTKAECDVHVVLTADAQKFITPLPFKTLSRNPVLIDLYEEENGWKPTHIKLADEADLLLIAPATANVLAKLAHGIADDALTCIALALNPKAKILVAPAMNGKMWSHATTQKNVATLKARGVEFIGPEEGMLSCGYEGLGRLWQVEEIAKRSLALLTQRGP